MENFQVESHFNARIARAEKSLEGLSVGDAFGERFFLSFELAAKLMNSRKFGAAPFDFQDEFVLEQFVEKRDLSFFPNVWGWTDDTALAIEVVGNLRAHGQIEAGELARAFSRRYAKNPLIGYGGAMHDLLPRLERENWEDVAPKLFGGTGSFGNGSAMRVAPLGAFFADDLRALCENAALSARVTHSHAEAVVGAIAIALGAAWCARGENQSENLWEFVLPRLDDSQVKRGIEIAQNLPPTLSGNEAAEILGSGELVSCPDTVPFCLWCVQKTVGRHPNPQIWFEEALWLCVAGLGDRDTTCAIVGGMIGANAKSEIPTQWLGRREALG